MERKIDFTIRFYIYRNFKDEKNETKRQKQ